MGFSWRRSVLEAGGAEGAVVGMVEANGTVETLFHLRLRPYQMPSAAGRMELPHGTSFQTGGTRIRIRGDKVAVALGGDRIAVA